MCVFYLVSEHFPVWKIALKNIYPPTFAILYDGGCKSLQYMKELTTQELTGKMSG